MTELVIVGDQGWTAEEWKAEQRRRGQKRTYERKYRRRPEVLARLATYQRAWRLANPDKMQEYRRREYAKRPAKPVPSASLHSLACTGPHRKRASCTPIPMYSRDLKVAS